MDQHSGLELALAAGSGGMAGAAGASLAAIRRKSSPRDMIYAVLFACAMSASLPFFTMWMFNAPWFVGIPIGFFAGVMVFGIRTWLEKNEERLPGVIIDTITYRMAQPRPYQYPGQWPTSQQTQYPPFQPPPLPPLPPPMPPPPLPPARPGGP